MPQAAEVFLERYQEPQDLYRACKAARASLVDALQSASGKSAEDALDDDDLMLEVWGFEEYFIYADWDFCDESLIFEDLVANADPRRDIFEVLDEAGVEIDNSYAVDLDADGRQDWLIQANTFSYRYGYVGPTSWLLWNSGTGYQADNTFGFTGELPFVRTEKILIPGEDRDISMVQVNDSLYTIEHLQRDGKESIRQVRYARWNYVERFEVYLEDNALYLSVYAYQDDVYPEPLLETYRWNTAVGRFESVDYVYMLVKAGEWEKAIELIQAQLDFWEGSENPDWYPIARYRYLLGLAYELMGDERAAVEVYWNLWQDFPESGYALMARAKLE